MRGGLPPPAPSDAPLPLPAATAGACQLLLKCMVTDAPLPHDSLLHAPAAYLRGAVQEASRLLWGLTEDRLLGVQLMQSPSALGVLTGLPQGDAAQPSAGLARAQPKEARWRCWPARGCRQARARHPATPTRSCGFAVTDVGLLKEHQQ